MIKKIAKIVESACKKETNFFGYGMWEPHTVSVVKYAKLLAKKTSADEEIVEIAALLHDYAAIKDYAMYENHHQHGANEAEKILQRFHYPADKIERVKQCIISHRGSKIKPKNSLEAQCVADADGMAHFDAIASLFHLAFFGHKMNVDEANHWLMKKLERSWSKLSPEAKKIIRKKYEASRLLLR